VTVAGDAATGPGAGGSGTGDGPPDPGPATEAPTPAGPPPPPAASDPPVHESHLHGPEVHESHLAGLPGQQSHLHEPEVHESHLHGVGHPDAGPAESAAAEPEEPPAGPLDNLITAVVALALGIAAVFGALALGAGTPAQPGPGTWPLLVGVVLTVLSAVLAVRARHTTDAERFTGASWQVLFAVATMVGFVAVIGTIGFEIPAVLLTFVWLRFLGRESWRLSIITSVAVVVALYLVFVAALSVRIPHLF
jgi:hypothetical protein